MIASSLWNNEWFNIYNNFIPAGMDSYSDTDAQMQIQTNPYPSSVTSHATNLGGEIERIRFVIASITGNMYWYEPPVGSINLLSVAITGEVRALAHATVPGGWLQLTGTVASPQNVSRSTYANLYAVLGTIWGAGDGLTTFGLPPVDQVMVGAGNLYTVGQLLGEAAHQLTIGELASHGHTITDPGHIHTVTDGDHSHHAGVSTGINAGAGVNGPFLQATSNSYSTDLSAANITINSHTTGITGTNNNGSSTPHNNIQPSMGMTFIIKT